MAGLFTKKKKEDNSNNTNTNAKQQQQQPQQRPAPPPNGLGLSNSNNGSASNLSYPHDNYTNNPNQQQQQQTYQHPPPAPLSSSNQPGMSMNPMSPTLAQSNINAGPPSSFQQFQQQSSGYNSAVTAAAMNASGPAMTTPTAAATATATAAATPPPPPQLFWTQRRILGATNPFPRFQHTSSVTSTGTDIFVYGGSQHGQPKGDLFVIDSATFHCQPITPGGGDPPMPKSGHTAVNIGQYIIYFGGWDQTTGQCDDSLHVLHTARKEWNKPAIQGPLPTPRHSHTGCSVGTTMYIFGGQVDDYYLGDIVSFDMKTITQKPQWEVIEPQTESPPARSGHCAAVYDGRIYIFGGADADYFYNDIWCFDTRNNTWTPIPASGYLPTGRHGHSCTIIDSVLYIFGGNSPDGTELNDAYAFKIHERRWYLFQNVGAAASPRSGHTMCTIKDKIFIIGGDAELGLLDDPAFIYYLEIPKIRFPDSNPQTVAPRQVLSAKLVPNRPGAGSPQPSSAPQMQQQAEAISEYDVDRTGLGPTAGGPPSRPDRPDRPARPERQAAQRSTSPALFATNNGHPNTNVPQDQGQKSLTAIGATPPPSSRIINGSNTGVTAQDYQAEGLSIATRRQTLKGEMDNAYGGTIVGTASPINSPTVNHKTIQVLNSSAGGPSPLRGTGTADSTSGEMVSPTAARFDRRTMITNNGVPSPAAPTSLRKEDEVNPYATDVIEGSAVGASSYVPPPSSTGSTRQISTTPTSGPSSGTSVAQQQQSRLNSSSRSPSPVTGRAYASTAGSAASPSPYLTGSTGATSAESISTDLLRLKKLEQQMQERDDELEWMRKRENWLVTEVMLARHHAINSHDSQNSGMGGEFRDDKGNAQFYREKRLSMAELERDLENRQLEGHSLQITKALLKIKEELRHAKMSIATQAQAASFKIKEAERIRTGALQEAAYLKAKLSSLASANTDPTSLAKVETDRAMDLEKRLTSALQDMELLESQYSKCQDLLQQEKHARISAEERSKGSSVLADQAQAAHTRALTELASLHARATKAEEESRSFATQLAESQAGFSGHQSTSTGLLQKIKELKQQVEDQEVGLDRIQKAYAVATGRAVKAETMYEETSKKLETAEAGKGDMASELTKWRNEAGRMQSKVEELEGRWQVSKDEVITLRKLVEDGLGAFNPRAKSPRSNSDGMSPERKHDSITILNTVSKVSELEHELSSLKVLHRNTQSAASKSAAELADAMIKLSHLEQSSMAARAEAIALQRQLAGEREGNVQLRNELTKTEQDLEDKIKELENHEVQLGLLKDVMREKGIIAEDVMLQAMGRRSGDYAASLESKLRYAEEKVHSLEMELKETQEHFTQQLEQFEQQRQATVQHSEKTGQMLRKLKNDLVVTTQEKESVLAEMKQLQEMHARCSELKRDGKGQGQDDERVQMLQLQWDEERQDLTSQLAHLQSQLNESETHVAELSQEITMITERVDEVQTLNETISEQLDTVQEQAETFKAKSARQEMQLKSDVKRLVSEIHQAQELLQAKEIELESATAANRQSGNNAAAMSAFAQQRQELEQRLKKAQETIQILEGDNSVLEARLQDSEKKVMLLLEDMQNTFSADNSSVLGGAGGSNSPFTSANLSGVHQQLNHQLAATSVGSPRATASPNAHRTTRVRSGSSNSYGSGGRAGSSNSMRPLGGGASPSGLQIGKKNQGNSPSPNQFVNDEDVYNYGSNGATGVGYYGNGVHQQHLVGNEDEDVHSSGYRDSVDSITRELEMLKVPWNKSSTMAAGGAGAAENGRKSSSPLQRPYQPTSQASPRQQPQQSQQRQQQQQQVKSANGNFYDSGNGDGLGNRGRYMYSDDEDDEDAGVSYLKHLQPRSGQPSHQQQHQQHQQHQHQQHQQHQQQFNDRSPSRLKEYEQMIDEMESAGRLH
ncbi:Negative regulator of mitotic exit [Mortierella claussenii]|nr:Negative regulator of mitotic exit [Mortierella claussenii]